MPAVKDMLGSVIPENLDASKRFALTTKDGARPVPAVITLKIDDSQDRLVADFLCIYNNDNDGQSAIKFSSDGTGPSALMSR